MTAADEAGPAGLAIGSFSSVSLDPPLVGFFPGAQSTSWPRIRGAGFFCVNVLGEDQEDICRVFAGSDADKFASVGWKPGRNGAPIINDVTAFIECSIESITPAGDHDFVLGRVLDMEVNREGPPLIFYRGGYARLSL